MLTGEAGATKLEAVTVTGLALNTGYEAVSVCYTVLNGYSADRAGLYLSVEVPTVVCVVVCKTSLEYVAVTYCKLSSEAVCILKSCIIVAVRSG